MYHRSNDCCGRCRHNRFEKIFKFGTEVSRFYCNNPQSEAYGCDTRYDDECPEYERKER